MVYNLISDQVTVQPSYTSGEKYFNKKAIRLDYERDWKLLRQLKNFELLRDKILDDLIPKPPANLFRRKNSKFSSSILKRYENSFDSWKSNDDINSDDEEIKLPRRLANAIIERDDEYFMEDKWDLKHATLVVNSLGQLQQEICGDTSDSSNKHSTELDQSPNSSKNDRIEEDRIKVKLWDSVIIMVYWRENINNFYLEFNKKNQFSFVTSLNHQ